MNDSAISFSKSAGLKTSTNMRAWKYIYSENSRPASRLNRIALRDGEGSCTYGQMFQFWERYASVFSALKMTEETQSRVGVMGTTAAETTFAFYALNMVGAEVSLVFSVNSFSPEKIFQTIRDEKLTDFIVTDEICPPSFLKELLEKKKSLGLRNVLLMHVPVCGPTVTPAITSFHEAKYAMLKSVYAPICMDCLIAAYANYPIRYTSDESREIAAIVHTSGTTGGTGKPIPLSDKALNSMGDTMAKADGYEFLKTDLVCGIVVDLCNAYALVNQVHAPLSLGGTIVAAPIGALNPMYYKAISEHKITLLFCVGAMFEMWMKQPFQDKFDFSSLKGVVIGGTYVSNKDKKRYLEFLKKHGSSDVPFITGYGISEMGGACIMSTEDPDDESIGYALPGVSIRLYDEENNKYLTPDDFPCEGVLYMSGRSATSGVLDGKVIQEMVKIDRKDYICTNDLVRADADGKITYLGRANRYFFNEKGEKYESGRVETELSRQPGIASCAVAPFYVKLTHNNIPMLCVTVSDGTADKPETVRKALEKAFLVEKTLGIENLPQQVLIADELPRNATGKIDLYAINRGNVEGDKYGVETQKMLNQISGIKLVPRKKEDDDLIQTVIQDIASEIKGNLPFGGKKKEEPSAEKTEEKKSCPVPNPMGGINVMNQLSGRMMSLLWMMFKSGQMKPAATGQNYYGLMQNMMPNMQQINPMPAYMNMAGQYLMQLMQKMNGGNKNTDNKTEE